MTILQLGSSPVIQGRVIQYKIGLVRGIFLGNAPKIDFTLGSGPVRQTSGTWPGAGETSTRPKDQVDMNERVAGCDSGTSIGPEGNESRKSWAWNRWHGERKVRGQVVSGQEANEECLRGKRMVDGPPAWPMADTRLRTRPPEWAAAFVYFLSSHEGEGTQRSAEEMTPRGCTEGGEAARPEWDGVTMSQWTRGG